MAPSLALAELEAAVQSQARDLAAHYTPHALVARMVRAALGPLCQGLAPQDVLGLRVLDPAVGSGRFLVAALDLLAGDEPRFRRLVAARCLYGVDVDPRAVDLARRALAEAAGCSRDELRCNIVVGDSLLGDPAVLLGVGAFDAVLTNPPWISYSGRQAAALDASRRRVLARRFASFRGWPTTHGAFLELAARLLRPGGRAALVLPHQVCHLAGYEAARRAALATCRFEPPPELLGEDCFQSVVQPAAVIYLRRTSGSERGMDGEVDERANVRTPIHPSAHPFIHPRLAGAILEKMRRHPPAPPGTFRDPGVHTGNSAELLLRDAPGPGLEPVREGRCIQPFRLAEARRWLDVRAEPAPGRYFRIGRPDAYLGARILVRQTASRPIAARHVEPTWFRNSVLACYGVPGLDDAALLSLLNSSLLAFYHRGCHPDSGQRAFPQVKVSHLQALPLARGAGELASLVHRIETLAMAGRETEVRQARRALDQRACTLYGLTDRESACVSEWLGETGGEKGRGRLAAL
ncbi:MAG TPA: N-6 DNA methylase [Planctomycetota bacterium]|nr:N-6 DNA methylase [Planctomycetota bacterium]